MGTPPPTAPGDFLLDGERALRLWTRVALKPMELGVKLTRIGRNRFRGHKGSCRANKGHLPRTVAGTSRLQWGRDFQHDQRQRAVCHTSIMSVPACTISATGSPAGCCSPEGAASGCGTCCRRALFENNPGWHRTRPAAEASRCRAARWWTDPVGTTPRPGAEP